MWSETRADTKLVSWWKWENFLFSGSLLECFVNSSNKIVVIFGQSHCCSFRFVSQFLCFQFSFQIWFCLVHRLARKWNDYYRNSWVVCNTDVSVLIYLIWSSRKNSTATQRTQRTHSMFSIISSLRRVCVYNCTYVSAGCIYLMFPYLKQKRT